MRETTGIGPRSPKPDLEGAPPKQRVLTIPLGASRGPVEGIVARLYTRDLDVWYIATYPDAAPVTVAKLLAILILDDTQTILHPQFLPPSAPAAILRRDGEIREGPGRLLAPWAVDEVNRLTSRLEEHEAAYVTSVFASLRGKTVGGFTRLQAGVLFKDTAPTARIGPPPPPVEVDISKSDAARWRLKWYQLVAMDYRRNRYLALLSDEQIARRIEDIIANAHVINREGLVSLDSTDPNLYHFLALLTEVQTEMAIRHGPHPAGLTKRMLSRDRMPDSLRRAGPQSAVVLLPSTPLPPWYLVKYENREFIERALDKGEMRISPASSFDDASLGSAVRDSELDGEIDYDPSVPFNDIAPGTMLLPRGRRPFRWSVGSDFYVFCVTDRLDTRLLLDFERDACMIIREPAEFESRLRRAVEAQLRGWRYVGGSVQYYDPLQVSPAQIHPPLSKHFRYAYQQEVRLAWMPPTSADILKPLLVNMGSLRDIAELVLPTRAGTC